jgi:hypothetical protein
MLITMIDVSFQKCHEVSKRYENQTKICNSLVKLENIAITICMLKLKLASHNKYIQ